MWRIFEQPFLTDSGVVEAARNEIQKALTNKSLTLVVGNGPTRSATFLGPRPDGTGSPDTGWEAAVVSVAKSAGIDKEFCDKDVNLLSLAEAILKEKGETEGKYLLTEAFAQELERPIKQTLAHEIIAGLALQYIVTTNYDLQLERALGESGRDWLALIRDVSWENVPSIVSDQRVLVIKMHGTLKPDAGTESKHSYSNPSWKSSPRDSIVIAESDYDRCMHELQERYKHKPDTSPLFTALAQPKLIIGKSIPWQDLSFRYALRATSQGRSTPAYFVATSPLQKDEKLNLKIMGLTPLFVNMPSTVRNEHFFVALVMAISRLCLEAENSFEMRIRDYAENSGLLRAPRFLALGLASHNSTGRLAYAGSTVQAKPSYELPKPGRRNFRLESEEHAGGSALVTCNVFSSVDWQGLYPRSLISVIGRDIYGREVLDFCKQRDVDIDGTEPTAANTWSSTVLLHDASDEKGNAFRGQRIFLDRGYSDKIFLGERAKEQLRSQLAHKDLRLLYFDKFLALSYPYNTQPRPGSRLLLDYKNLLDKLSTTRHEVNILYETGATGSENLTVETVFRDNVNILTAAFPFFFMYILPPEHRGQLGGGNLAFHKKEFKDTDFSDERDAIQAVLQALQVNPGQSNSQYFGAPRAIVEGGHKWVGRDHPKKWLVVTLHDFGALTIDLRSAQGVYVPAATTDGQQVQNTAGAGDTFRGAFCYALLKCRDLGLDSTTMMAEVTKFAVMMATKKCTRFKLTDALAYLREQPKSYAWPNQRP